MICFLLFFYKLFLAHVGLRQMYQGMKLFYSNVWLIGEFAENWTNHGGKRVEILGFANKLVQFANKLD